MDETRDAARDETRQAIESILMVADNPVEPTVLAQLLETPKAEIEAHCADLAEEYQRTGRGFVLARVAGGYRFQSHPELAHYVERFVLDGQSSRLSAAALETLAIVAYKQPISRMQIAAIRGVNVDGVLRTLQQRGYVDEVSRDPGPGNAVLFGTTPLFLERVGLDSTEDLPPLAQFVPGADVVEALEDGLRPDPIEPTVSLDGEPTPEAPSEGQAGAGIGVSGDEAPIDEASADAHASDHADVEDTADRVDGVNAGEDAVGVDPADLDDVVADDLDAAEALDQDAAADAGDGVEAEHATVEDTEGGDEPDAPFEALDEVMAVDVVRDDGAVEVLDEVMAADEPREDVELAVAEPADASDDVVADASVPAGAELNPPDEFEPEVVVLGEPEPATVVPDAPDSDPDPGVVVDDAAVPGPVVPDRPIVEPEIDVDELVIEALDPEIVEAEDDVIDLTEVDGPSESIREELAAIDALSEGVSGGRGEGDLSTRPWPAAASPVVTARHEDPSDPPFRSAPEDGGPEPRTAEEAVAPAPGLESGEGDAGADTSQVSDPGDPGS